MSNARFTTQDAVTVMKHLRNLSSPAKNVMWAYELCASVIARVTEKTEKTRRVGHQLNADNELVPIPGAISGYINGKPIVAVPLVEPEPSGRKLLPVSIDSLCDTDGNVTSAETRDENGEAVIPVSDEPCYDESVESARALMVDPQSIPDERLETSESSDSETEDHE